MKQLKKQLKRTQDILTFTMLVMVLGSGFLVSGVCGFITSAVLGIICFGCLYRIDRLTAMIEAEKAMVRRAAQK